MKQWRLLKKKLKVVSFISYKLCAREMYHEAPYMNQKKDSWENARNIKLKKTYALQAYNISVLADNLADAWINKYEEK